MPTDWWYWLILIGMIVLLFLPQWLARRRHKQKLGELQIGDRVVTAGGFIGTLTHFDPAGDLARLHLGEGVEVAILPGAISGRYHGEITPLSEVE